MTEKEKCPECLGGKGRRVIKGADLWIDGICPTCHGTGEKPDATMEANAKEYEYLAKLTEKSPPAVGLGGEVEPVDEIETIFEHQQVAASNVVVKAKPVDEKLMEKLEQWVTDYRDVAERNALAETPKDTVIYLVMTFIEPLIQQAVDQAVKAERERIETEIAQGLFAYIEDLFPEESSGLWNTKEWKGLKKEWQSLKNG